MTKEMKTVKRIVITGASDGIGAAAARQLAALGQEVVIVGRNAEKTEKLARELGAEYHIADYSRLSDVVRLAKELSACGRIDVLANNAGAVQKEERELTEDGIERTFQINMLAQFLLTRELLPLLKESGATVIQTSSIAANLFGAKLDIGDLNSEKKYSAFTAYGCAKLCDILFTRELENRYGGEGINAVAFEPGVVRTNFAAGSIPAVDFCYHSFLKYLFTVSPERSAKRLVALATGEPGKDFLCGEAYSKRKPMKLKFRDEDGKAARALWEECEKMLASRFPSAAGK